MEERPDAIRVGVKNSYVELNFVGHKLFYIKDRPQKKKEKKKRPSLK